MGALRTDNYEIFEGVASEVTSARRMAVFVLAGHHLRVNGSRLPLQEGDFVRVLIWRAPESGPCRVLALQRRGDTGIQYVGRRVSLHAVLIAAIVLAAGLSARVWWLVMGAAVMMMLGLPLSTHEADIVRRFEAYCRTSPTGTLRS